MFFRGFKKQLRIKYRVNEVRTYKMERTASDIFIRRKHLRHFDTAE